ncbi:hypothetical protein IHE45_14G048600 [Dioscorea alata]|uniref:Uncharacterized protein n=1 Tax=Dioscorea alata TaxID=55571 RepID=A0ACB7URS7_DIOAL|nr:hypothetical protein IHE45_14G048600 [Dioscorea alata]
MTTSTRDSHEINIEPDQHNRREKSNGESMRASYSIGKRERIMTKNEEELLIEEAKKKLDRFGKQIVKRSIFRFPVWAKSITPRIQRIGPFQHDDQENSYGKNVAVLDFLSRINKPLEHVMREMREVVEELQAHYAFLEDKWRNDMKFVETMIFDGCFILMFLRGHSERSLVYDPHYGTHKASHRPIPQFRDMVFLDNQLPLLAVKVLFQILARSMNVRPPTDGDINNQVFMLLGMDDMVDKTQTLGLHILDLYRKGIIGPLTTNNDDDDDDGDDESGGLPIHDVSDVLASSSPQSFRDVFGPSPPDSLQPSPTERGKILSAMKLHESGVIFKKSPTNKITDISFDKDKGILMLPPFFIDEATESTFLSLMLFELLYLARQGNLQFKLRKVTKNLQRLFPEQIQMELPEQLQREIDEQINRELLPKLMTTTNFEEVILGKIPEERLKLLLPRLQIHLRQLEGFDEHVKSYIFFMKELIESGSDVRLLKSKEIIFLDVENELAAVQLLNRLTKDLLHAPTANIKELRREVNIYSQRKVNRLVKRRVNRWLGILMNIYFDNPWSTIAAIGGVMILVLTCLQTYYSFLSYQHPKSG